jgi:putative transposase
MEFTKVQLRTLIYNHIKNKENGLNDILELTLNAMMQAERREELAEQGTFNKANGYRPGRVYGNGKVLELRIPRDRNGTFYPKVLTLLRNQKEVIGIESLPTQTATGWQGIVRTISRTPLVTLASPV